MEQWIKDTVLIGKIGQGTKLPFVPAWLQLSSSLEIPKEQLNWHEIFNPS